MARIYTRGGDGGETSLFTGERARKDAPWFDALGAVDELSSALGVVRALSTPSNTEWLASQMLELQQRLVDVGSAVATPLTTASTSKLRRVTFDAAGCTALLEGWIDEMDRHLPPLTTFVLPGDGLVSSHLHHARSVCRRAERSVVPLVREAMVDPAVGMFLNRLSDYLFMAARMVASRDSAYRKARPGEGVPSAGGA